MRFRHAKIGHEKRHRLARHRWSSVSVNRQLVTRDPVFGQRLGDEPLGQDRGLTMREHPAHDVAAEDVQHDVQVVVRPFLRTQQFRDVPGPQFVRLGREQLWLGVVGTAQLDRAISLFAQRAEIHFILRIGEVVFSACISSGNRDVVALGGGDELFHPHGRRINK